MLNEGITPAVDEVLHLVRVLTKSGEALRNGYIEIWQTGTNGSYVHSGERNTGGYDSNFQGSPPHALQGSTREKVKWFRK